MCVTGEVVLLCVAVEGVTEGVFDNIIWVNLVAPRSSKDGWC